MVALLLKNQIFSCVNLALERTKPLKLWFHDRDLISIFSTKSDISIFLERVKVKE